MAALGGFQSFLKNQKFSNLASYALVGVMSICILLSLVGVAEQLQPAWRGNYVRGFGLFVILEAVVARFVIDSFDENKAWIFRLSEWGILLIAAKLTQLASIGFQQLPLILASWQVDLINFFDSEYLLILLLVGLIWIHTTRYLFLISVLDSYESDLQIYEFVQLRTERETARISMVNQFLAVGVGMILLITMARSDMRNLDVFSGQGIAFPLAISVLPLVIYFLSGLVLLSLSRFAILRGAWLVGKQKIQPDIAKNWMKYALLFFGIVSIIALFLPTLYTQNFLQTSAVILQFLVEVVMFLLGLLVFPFIWIYSLIVSFLPSTENAVSQPSLPEFDLPESPPPSAGLPPWFEIARNVIFWLLFIGIIFILVRYYLKQNKSFIKTLSISGLGNWFKKVGLDFLLWVSGIRKKIRTVLAIKSDEQNKTQEEKRPILSWINQQIGGKSPREQIIQRYKLFIQQADQLGLRKKPGQTPLQYTLMLDQQLPEETKPYSLDITETFIKARYSPNLIEKEDVQRLAPLWKRVLGKLRVLNEK